MGRYKYIHNSILHSSFRVHKPSTLSLTGSRSFAGRWDTTSAAACVPVTWVRCASFTCLHITHDGVRQWQTALLGEGNGGKLGSD